jgi:outer membrane protein
MKRVCLLFFLSFLFLSEAAASALDDYIRQGLENNLALKQQEFSLQKSLEALAEAKGLFFPAVSLEARYSRAGGGRIIDVPVGDMLNPVYKSLNDLFRLHGITTNFPTDVPNMIFPFFREREQETKVRLVQPVFQPAIFYNYQVRSNLSKMDQVQLQAFKRQLVTDIKTAYYTYLKALGVKEVLDQTRLLLEENLQVGESLFKNGKATEDVVFRAKAEMAGLEEKMAEAEKNRVQAAAYFNFLVNRPFGDTKQVPAEDPVLEKETRDLPSAVRNALEHRDEFARLMYAQKAVSQQVKLARSNYWPTLTAVLDYGIQGEKYSFKKDDDYWMFSLVMQWNLFNGGQDRAKSAQARLEHQRLQVQQTELEKQVELQVTVEFQALKAAGLALEASIQKEHSARSAFEIAAKKYQYGAAPQVEYLDARTTYTGASVSRVISRCEYLIQQARLEGAAAWCDLNRYR